MQKVNAIQSSNKILKIRTKKLRFMWGKTYKKVFLGCLVFFAIVFLVLLKRGANSLFSLSSLFILSLYDSLSLVCFNIRKYFCFKTNVHKFFFKPPFPPPRQQKQKEQQRPRRPSWPRPRHGACARAGRVTAGAAAPPSSSPSPLSLPLQRPPQQKPQPDQDQPKRSYQQLHQHQHQREQEG